MEEECCDSELTGRSSEGFSGEGNFNHDCASKEDLLLEILERQETAFLELCRTVSAAASDPSERVLRLFFLTSEALRSQPTSSALTMGCLKTALTSDGAMSLPRVSGRVAEAQHALALALQREVLGPEEGAGEGPPEDLSRAMGLLAYLQGVATLARAVDDPSLVRKLAPGAVALLRPSFGPPAGRQDPVEP